MTYTARALALIASLQLANANLAVNSNGGKTINMEELVRRREAALKRWEEKSLSGESTLMRSRGMIDPITNKPLVSLLTKVAGEEKTQKSLITQNILAEKDDKPTRRRRHLQEGGLPLPYPADGDTIHLEAAGAEIHFEEDTSSMNSTITCFYFDQDDDGIDVSYTCEEIFHDVEAGIATVSMGGLSEGSWTWWAEDENNVATSKQTFTVEVTGGGSKELDFVGEDEWTFGGQIQGTTGRIYYSSNDVDYACSGTAIKDHKSGRSLVVTAAHCVWDDIDEVWGSNVVFIPNRDATQSSESAESIHRQCAEDICGCWTMSAGFVHQGWRDAPWPARLVYDWGIWVVDDVGAHSGTKCGSDALDEAVDPMEFDIGVDLSTLDSSVTALGYSLEHNPDFRYCADKVGFNQPADGIDTYWLPGCGLTGGASGGPWLMDSDTATGRGKLVSVNSWSYSDGAGMGGPIIDAMGARCLVNAARDADFHLIESYEDGEEGVFVNCYDRECIRPDELEAYNRDRRLRGNRRILRVCGEHK